ncbi:MAG: VWA domain-containing protein [Deltaproteobacteria bacterium]|nr:VWA domain-containing protein [Deltaproteobacteria bacterium]MCW5801217.1 VWA domain-containing protein [Deltaproteobacteria bacterium]
MFDLHFDNPDRVHFLWLALAITIGLFVLELRGRDALSSFLSPAMQRRLTARASAAASAVRLGLLFVAMAAGILASMRPQARGEHEQVPTSRAAADVMFLLDTSRSMLAEDTPPNRFARAKVEIGQLVDRLEGHRVGIVAFAGRAAQVCPLTPDHSFFRTVLTTLDTRSAGKGGTKLGEGIKVALRGFPKEPGAKLIVLITDGDDQDPYSEEAAKAARDAGVKIVAVGLGSETGSQITLTDPQTGAKTTLMYEGAPAISKLNGDQLRKVAMITEGAYIPAGTSAIDLDAIMESHVRPIVREASDAAVRRIPAERYPWFVLLALLALVGSLAVGASAGTGGAEPRRAP